MNRGDSSDESRSNSPDRDDDYPSDQEQYIADLIDDGEEEEAERRLMNEDGDESNYIVKLKKADDGLDEEKKVKSSSSKKNEEEHYSAAAERLYQAISSQNRYSHKEALGRLLHEVQAAPDRRLSSSELLDRLQFNDEEKEMFRARSRSRGDRPTMQTSGMLGAVPSSTTGGGARVDPNEEEEDEEDNLADGEGGGGDGFAATQLASVARLISRGGSPAESISALFDHHLVANSLESFVEFVLKKLKNQWRTLLHGIFPVQHIQTMVLVCLVQLISVDRLVRVLPIGLSYLAFFGMAYATLKMFHSKHMIREYHVWRRLLHVFSSREDSSIQKSSGKSGVVDKRDGTTAKKNDDSDSESAMTQSDISANSAPVPTATQLSEDESQYSMETMEPYAAFFAAVIIFIICFGLCGKYVPNCLLLCGVSIFFCASCFVALTDELDWVALLAQTLNLFAHLSMIQKKLKLNRWAILKEWMQFRLFGMKISLSLGSVCFLSVPALYLFMCAGKSKKEIIRTLIPQMVCFIWSDTALTLFIAGFVRFELGSVLLTVAIIFLLLFPTGTGAALVLAVIIGNIRGSYNIWSGLKALSILGIVLLPFLYTKIHGWLKPKLPNHLPDFFSTMKEKRTSMVLMLGVYAMLVLFSISLLYHGSALGPGSQRHLTNLSWTHFENHCGAAAKLEDNQIENQELCSQLKGMAVKWKGAISVVRVMKVDNSLETLLDYLPLSIAESVRCFYGEAPGTGNAKHWAGMDSQSCSLARHHWYTFEVEVNGPWGEKLISSAKGTVALTASHVYHPLLVHLREGDVVKFVAFFDQYPVTKWTPKLRLLQLSCVSCKFAKEKRVMEAGGDGPPQPIPMEISDMSIYNSFWSRSFYALKFLFNFFFSPFLYIPTS